MLKTLPDIYLNCHACKHSHLWVNGTYCLKKEEIVDPAIAGDCYDYALIFDLEDTKEN